MPKIVPDIVREQTIVCVMESMSVREAAQLMSERSIAAVVICHPGGKLAGIMTERDVTSRVVAKGLDPEATTVGAVMTPDPDTLEADDRPAQALSMMRQHNYRHLPVVDENHHVIGMVSVRDLYAFVQSELESDLNERDKYIMGETYGAVN
jgi:CBS domain-containing protein